MEKKKKLKIIIPIVIVAVILIFTALVLGIEYYMNNIYEGSKSYITLSSDFTDVLVTDENSAIEAVKSAANELGITDEKNNLSVVSSNETDSGATYKLQQYYDGYPVYKATATLSVDTSGNVTELTSYFKEIKKYKSTKSNLSSDNLREKLINDWELDDSDTTNRDGIHKPSSTAWLLIDPTVYLYQLDNGKFITAYIVKYFTTTHIIRTDGKIVESHSNTISDSSVKCYNSDGSREFNGYYYTDNDYYKAYDSERNIRIWTLQKKYNSKNKFKTAEELISDDEYFGNTENEKKQEYDTAVVFMNNISKIYDYYNDTFSETAYGNLLLCYNDAEDKGNNGFGGTAKTEAGDIGALYIGYNKGANDIDLLAHEYTHIVTSSKIKWADNAEQWEKEKDYEGALKEAYSDIFGEIITSKISGEEPDWVHGDRIIYAPMSNNYPANINDKEWKFTLLQWVANGFKQGYGMDIGGGNITDYAHGFSTVISHSAYLMWNGIDGNKSKKIDIDTLAEIWYNSLNIISESQNNKGDNLTAVTFDDCVSAVLTSAKKLFKNGSITEKQYNCIIEAFNQVGILNENDLVDENKKEENKQADNVDYERIYYQYIKDNLNIIDYDKFPDDENNTGVFSALIEDFDNDKIKEMVTFSYENKSEGQVVLNLYKYLDGKVTLCDTSKEAIYASGAGVWQRNMCGTFEDEIIKIQSDGYSYGGSYHFSNYMSYNIKDNKFFINNNYSLYEVPKYEKYEYKETVNEKTYSSSDEWSKAVTSSGYDVKSHLHAGYSNSKFNPETDTYKDNELFKGNHIFTLINSNSMIKSGIYGFINDNTDLKSKLGISSLSDKTTSTEKNTVKKETSTKERTTIKQSKSSDDFKYRLLDNGTISITKYEGKETSLNIPTTIDGYTVTSIDNEVFSYNLDLVKVVIPDSIITIGESAFYDCENLENVTLSKNITSIEFGTFGMCYKLENISIGNKVEKIGQQAFQCCNLKNIIIPNSVNVIDDYAFSMCRELKEISFSNNINTIGSGAFGDCISLKNVHFQGTKEEWINININVDNECLTNSNIQFN